VCLRGGRFDQVPAVECEVGSKGSDTPLVVVPPIASQGFIRPFDELASRSKKNTPHEDNQVN